MGVFFFFFQAEDGIRDYKVTGVQTCALPIFGAELPRAPRRIRNGARRWEGDPVQLWAPPDPRRAQRLRHMGVHSPKRDRKSTRLNSSHLVISYAVFCLKKKKKPYSIVYVTDN